MPDADLLIQTRIRRPLPTEAEAFVRLRQQCDRESDFLLFGAEEWIMDVARMQEVLTTAAAKKDPLILTAIRDGRMLGYVSGQRGISGKTQHGMKLGLAVSKEAQGQGLGRHLLLQLEAEARQIGIVRLELSVMVPNQRAIALYEAVGYQWEGLLKGSVNLDGQLIDEVVMAKLLLTP